MWRIVLTVVLWKIVSSQPVTDDPHSRDARQVDFIECCPCPGKDGLQVLAAAREAAVDDCPCRLRDPDSHGAPSEFLPRAVRPIRPLLTHESPKDDVKPLLKPEVGLASSMLETLREVTDEEYQEALARDAARNAARVAELGDTQPDTAKNIVTIIVNPREHDARDSTPEPSQSFETRCIQPSGQVRETEDAPLFNLHPNTRGRNLIDMENGASNVQENFLGLNKALEGLRLKTTPAVLKLFPPRKAQGGNIQSLLKLKDNKQVKNVEIIPKKTAGSLEPKLPKLKLSSHFRKNEDLNPIKPLSLDFNKLNIPKFRTSLARKPTDDSRNNDNNPSSSIIQEQVVPIENRNTPKFDLKSLLPATDAKSTVFNLKNLLNLKDVELIPPKSPKITLPGLNLFPPLRTNTHKSERLTNNCKTITKENEESTEQEVHTEILDAIPHASENDQVVNVNDIEASNADIDNPNTIQKDENIQTQILDALPSASENNEVTVESENRKDTQSNMEEEATDFDEDSEPQKTETEFSKDRVENFDLDDNSAEFFIENNANDQFEEFGISQDNDQPINEIDISGNAFDTGIEEFDLEIDEDDGSIPPPSVAFSTDDGGPSIIEEENQEPSRFQFEPMQNSQDFESFEILPIQVTNDNNDLSRDDFFGQLPLDLDDIAETSNQNIQIASTELTEVRNTLPKNDFQINKTMDNEKELDSVFDSNQNSEEALVNPLHSDESSEVEPLTQDTEIVIFDDKDAQLPNESTNKVHMHDLQRMSDSLLRKSEKRTESGVCKCGNLVGEATSAGTSFSNSKALQSAEKDSFSQENNNERSYSDMDSSATSLKENFESSHNVDLGFEQNNNIDHNDSRSESLDSTLAGKAITDNACPSNIQPGGLLSQNEKSASNLPRTSEIDMASAASESNVFKTHPQHSSVINPGSPLLHQSIVVQPSSIFPPIAPLDLSTVTLPTLDDIRLGIANLLGGNAKAVEDEEIDSAEDCPDLNPAMSSDASTTNTKSALPPFRTRHHLEDINLDIFQINPLSRAPLSSKMPSLNLNTFRTKLALPKRLGLKPMKLQSSLGAKNGGLLGATLTFGPDKSSSQKLNHITNLGSILDRQGSDILGIPLSNMPSLEELRSKIRANTETLLKSSLPTPLDDTLRTTEALGNSLRSHTENTMRNLQQTLSSTLNEARVNKAGEKFARPQDLLEMVSSAHEDVKDKLHGIQVDLQDRLTSLHDNILERSKLRIPTLQTPLFSRLGRLEDSSYNVRSNSRKTPSPKLIVRKRKPMEKVNQIKEQNKMKPFKMSKAASLLTPKSVEVPKLMATSSKPPFLRPLQRDQSVKLKEPSALFSNDERQTLNKKKLNPFGVQTKITISTTPRPASFGSRPINRSQFEAKSTKLRDQQQKIFGNQRLGQIKSFSDSRGFASEPQSSKVPAPKETIASTGFSTNSEEKHDWPRKNLKSSKSSLPVLSLNKPLIPKVNLPTLKPLVLTSSRSSLTPFPTSQKPTESPLVSKMREAIRIRFSRPVKTSEKLKTGKPQGKEEMTKSASESRGVAVRLEPMKENVSYKCKMVCVKD